MARAGAYRDRVTFDEPVKTDIGGGGSEVVWTDRGTIWGHYMPERGRERVEAGRLSSVVGAVLRVRYASVPSGVDVGWRVLVDGVAHNIRSVTNPDRRNRELEMVLERGVAS